MNKKLLIFGAAIVALSLFVSSSDAQAFELNVKRPVDTIVNSWSYFKDNLNLLEIVKLALKVFRNCLLPLIPIPGRTTTPSSLSNSVPHHSPQDELQLEIQLAEKLAEAPVADLLKTLEIKCDSPEFKILHDFVWIEDDQFPDLIKFLHKYGYSNIYDTIKQGYEQAGCPAELIGGLPTAPPPASRFSSSHSRPATSNRPNVRQQILDAYKPSHVQQEATCNILEIVLDLPSTGLLNIVQLAKTVITEFNTDPSLHFLIGKLSEPVKGKSVRKFRNLQPIRTLEAELHEQLKQNPIWKVVFEFIKSLVGIDFNVLNPVSLIISLVEYLIWGTPFA